MPKTRTKKRPGSYGGPPRKNKPRVKGSPGRLKTLPLKKGKVRTKKLRKRA